jgi:signal transduction histidine kinase
MLAVARSREALVDSLESRLSMAPSAADSIKILYDLYDLSFLRDRAPAVERIYKTALRCGDTSTRLDALRILTNISHRNDSMQEVQQCRASLISPSPEQKETMVFIKVARASTAARTLSGEELRNKLHMVLQGYRYDQQVDLYRRIELLFTICKYLEGRSTSDLLFGYLRELETLVNKLPSRPGSLRSAFYTASAIANSDAGHHAKAVEDDRKLIEIMQEFEKRYKAEGREFCTYNNNYYIVYRRMLGNYEALKESEIDELYKKVYQLAKLSPDIVEDIETSGHLVDAFYYMAKKEYAKALPLLRVASQLNTNRIRRTTLLQMTITAATNCGDNEALLEAYKRYLPLVEQRFTENEEDRLLEYQVLYDVNSLTASNADLEAQYARTEVSEHKRMLTISIVALCLVLIILCLILYAYRRRKALTIHLSETNQMLTNERDNLRRIQRELIAARDKAKVAERHKTDFINTISHEVAEPVNNIVGYSQLIVDSVDDKRREVLEKFVQVIELNCDLLRTLVNDVLDVAELENSRIVIKLKNVTLKKLCEAAVNTVSNRLNPEVELTVIPEVEGMEYNIDTDPVRAEQVIVNLLTNAIKFTEKGHITVTYGIDKVTAMARIVVEDTGPGIQKGKERKIFDRFYKGSQVNQGIGLGLTICKLLSRLLGGGVELDMSYTEGARFIFTLPINKPDKTAQAVDF